MALTVPSYVLAGALRDVAPFVPNGRSEKERAYVRVAWEHDRLEVSAYATDRGAVVIWVPPRDDTWGIGDGPGYVQISGVRAKRLAKEFDPPGGKGEMPVSLDSYEGALIVTRVGDEETGSLRAKLPIHLEKLTSVREAFADLGSADVDRAAEPSVPALVGIAAIAKRRQEAPRFERFEKGLRATIGEAGHHWAEVFCLNLPDPYDDAAEQVALESVGGRA